MAKSPDDAMATMVANLKEKTGSFNAMVSHRVRLEKPGDVDKELVDWLKKAYESA